MGWICPSFEINELTRGFETVHIYFFQISFPDIISFHRCYLPRCFCIKKAKMKEVWHEFCKFSPSSWEKQRSFALRWAFFSSWFCWPFFNLFLLVFILLQCLSLHWEFWSCGCLNFYWLSLKFKMGCPIAVHSLWLSQAYWDSLCGEDIFKLRASAAATEFCEWGLVKIDVYIFHQIYKVKPHSFPWFSAACNAAIVHRYHFPQLHQQNKSSKSKAKLRKASNHCKRVLEAAKPAEIVEKGLNQDK